MIVAKLFDFSINLIIHACSTFYAALGTVCGATRMALTLNTAAVIRDFL